MIVLSAAPAPWEPSQFAVNFAIIAALTVISDVTFAETGSLGVRVSGSFLGIMLASVLLGGGPGAIIGMISIAIGWLWTREPGYYFRNNLVTYAWYPLIGGLWFQAAVRVTHNGALHGAHPPSATTCSCSWRFSLRSP